MGSLLSMLGTVVTEILSYIGDISSAIIDSPILVMSLAFFLIGGCVGIFGRLLSRG